METRRAGRLGRSIPVIGFGGRALGPPPTRGAEKRSVPSETAACALTTSRCRSLSVNGSGIARRNFGMIDKTDMEIRAIREARLGLAEEDIRQSLDQERLLRIERVHEPLPIAAASRPEAGPEEHTR